MEFPCNGLIKHRAVNDVRPAASFNLHSVQFCFAFFLCLGTSGVSSAIRQPPMIKR